MATEKLSPGMQQYVDIKKQYPDAFLPVSYTHLRAHET